MSKRLTNTQLLRIWEQGESVPLFQKANLLLEAIVSDESAAIATWTIGQRDRQLLYLREALFGQKIEGLARCPECEEQLEIALSTQDLLLEESDPSQSFEILFDDYTIEFRLPTIGDVNELAYSVEQRRNLLTRCVLRVESNGKAVDMSILPSDYLDIVSAQIGLADPQAHIEFDLTCPNCEAQWQAPFDIVGFLWNEIGSWARRILREIHLIAMTYGWNEDEILHLTPLRRRTYINMIIGT